RKESQMTRFSTITGSLVTAFALSLFSADRAAAGHERHRPQHRADVDISLRASYEPRGFAPSISVTYRVSVEDARRLAAYEMQIRLTENGRAVRDRFGRPVTICVPMSRATRVGRDEVEFRGQVSVPMAGVACRSDCLSVVASVTPAGGGPVLETERTDVR